VHARAGAVVFSVAFVDDVDEVDVCVVVVLVGNGMRPAAWSRPATRGRTETSKLSEVKPN
jgi:hypothetical protein